MATEKITIIAEIGHNFNGSMRLAKELITEAKVCGADVVKFQLYDIDKIKKPHQSRYYELKYAQLNEEEVVELSEFCKGTEIELLFSCFDVERVEWCEVVKVKQYKIASRSVGDTSLWDAILKTGKPIIASLGMFDKPEYEAFYLYCVSEYPAYIKELPKFDYSGYSGFSDHTLGCYWAREAIKRGATIIEKHFTISKDLPGYNQKGSADPTELKDLVSFARHHEKGLLI